MRLFVLPVLLLLSLLCSPCSAAPLKGQPAPPFQLTAASGESLSLSSYRGSVLILDFFAPWCAPCRLAIPHLLELQRTQGGQGLKVLGLTTDELTDKKLIKFMKELKITYPVASASDSVQRDYGVRSLPLLYVIDKKGRVAGVFNGFNSTVTAALDGLVKSLLAEK